MMPVIFFKNILFAVTSEKFSLKSTRLGEGEGIVFNVLSPCGDLMVSAPGSGLNGPGSSPGWGHCVVFLSKTLYSHSASLHPGV